MVDFHGNKKRLSISLSLFAPNDHNVPKKSPKSFQPNGVVGLGIVAALSELDQTHDPYFSVKSSRAAILAVSPKSNPIPILNPNSFVPKIGWSNLKDDQIELSEEYTCVISHTGDNLIKKREYYDGILANESETTTSYWGGGGGSGSDSGMGVEKSPLFLTADFLNSCNLCKKLLHGLDIFMYRGERAFCSAECRCKQIAMEERKEKQKEKCGSGAMKTTSLDQCSSASPCSSPMQFFAGVAAA